MCAIFQFVSLNDCRVLVRIRKLKIIACVLNRPCHILRSVLRCSSKSESCSTPRAEQHPLRSTFRCLMVVEIQSRKHGSPDNVFRPGLNFLKTLLEFALVSENAMNNFSLVGDGGSTPTMEACCRGDPHPMYVWWGGRVPPTQSISR